MASEYTELYAGDEEKLRDGLEILEKVTNVWDLDLWLYGVVTNPNLLSVAKDAIIKYDEDSMDEFGDSTLTDEDVEAFEIGVYIQVSADVIDMLKGSGYPIRELEFVYQDGEGEGIRTRFFSDSDHVSSGDKIRISDMTELTIAQSESYIDQYFLEKSGKLRVKINRKVNRNEEATEHAHPEGKQPDVPAAEPQQPPQAAPPAPASPMPKQTSLKLSSIVEDFLGG